jgi:hypothetical protein
MTRTACCRNSLRVPRVCWLGSWAREPASEDGEDGEDGKGKAPPSVRRMWLMALRFYEAMRMAMPSPPPETANKSTHREPSVFESWR